MWTADTPYSVGTSLNQIYDYKKYKASCLLPLFVSCLLMIRNMGNRTLPVNRTKVLFLFIEKKYGK
jgi:hypothetical protein